MDKEFSRVIDLCKSATVDTQQNTLARVLSFLCENTGEGSASYNSLKSRVNLALEHNFFESAALLLIPNGFTTNFAMQDRHSLRWQWELHGKWFKVNHRAETIALAIAACSIEASYHRWSAHWSPDINSLLGSIR